MRHPYQLSKIGKEKRKSGSFRLCRSTKKIECQHDLTRLHSQRASEPGRPRPRVKMSKTSMQTVSAPSKSASTGEAEAAPAGSRTARLAAHPTKKLPQVGQEPVEAVESRHSNPDGPMIIDPCTPSKDIPSKIPEIFPKSCRLQKPPFSHLLPSTPSANRRFSRSSTEPQDERVDV
jgi:hypothetical protein